MRRSYLIAKSRRVPFCDADVTATPSRVGQVDV